MPLRKIRVAWSQALWYPKSWSESGDEYEVAAGTKEWFSCQTRHGKHDGLSFYHTTQNSAKFKIYELFISRIFHLLFSDHG